MKLVGVGIGYFKNDKGFWHPISKLQDTKTTGGVSYIHPLSPLNKKKKS